MFDCCCCYYYTHSVLIEVISYNIVNFIQPIYMHVASLISYNPSTCKSHYTHTISLKHVLKS